MTGNWGITHSTIAGNSSGISINGFLTLRNSIVAKNGGFNNTLNDITGGIANSGYNLIGKSAGGSGYVPSDILDVDPLLGSLSDNGGPTKTMAMLPGSPAIDSGTTRCARLERRGPGFPRIVNGTIDSGEFEVQATEVPNSERTSRFVTPRIPTPRRGVTYPPRETPWGKRPRISPERAIQRCCDGRGCSTPKEFSVLAGVDVHGIRSNRRSRNHIGVGSYNRYSINYAESQANGRRQPAGASSRRTSRLTPAVRRMHGSRLW